MGDTGNERDAEAVDEELRSQAVKHHQDRSHYAPALERWLSKLNPQATDVHVDGIRIPSATGFSNETAFFEADWNEGGNAHHERFVARIEPGSGALFPKQTADCDVSVAVQYRAMQTAAAHGLPMSPLIGYEDDRSIIGQPFFVMGHVDGVVPADVPRYSEAGFLVDEATPQQRLQMVSSGLQAMAAIHAIDWRNADLQWLHGGDEPTQARQLALYRRFVTDQLAGRDHPVMYAALDWLEANDPHDERVGLIWGDARLGNVIWDDYTPAAVCDWEACAICPTEADIGWWLMFDRMSFDDLGAPLMDGFPTREEMIAIYEQASGNEVRNAHYWEVFGAMRFAAIYIPLADRMVAAGLVPAEINMAVNNPVTAAVAALLG